MVVLVDVEGFEPPTFCLQSRHSPAELHAQKRFKLIREPDADMLLILKPMVDLAAQALRDRAGRMISALRYM